MRRIFLIRHAKSDWTNSDKLKDIDRPLSTRGVRDSYTMADRLKSKNIEPDLIISSNGIRSLHTAVIFSKILQVSEKTKIVEDLYFCSADEILEQINIFVSKTDILFIIAHNPGIEDFVYETQYDNDKIPTCSIIEYSFSKKIKKVSFEDLKFESFDFPKNI